MYNNAEDIFQDTIDDHESQDFEGFASASEAIRSKRTKGMIRCNEERVSRHDQMRCVDKN